MPVQSRDDRIDEFTRQPHHALVLGLDPRSGFQHQPRNIGGETERKDQRKQQVDPGTQGKLLPHGFLSESEVAFVWE